MIFSLIHDFADALDAMPSGHPRRRTLELLDEAIRRDVHFIDRHPTTLFQCLWNTCWWYDCPEVARYYDLTERTSPDALPWTLPVAQRLAPILESWRVRKEKHMPDFPWLRSLRPPRERLNTAQQTVLQVERDEVYGLSFSPDGQRLATGSRDGAVRVWKPASGLELYRTHRRSNTVYGVSFSPDGKRLVSGAWDKSVRVWDAATGAELMHLEGHTKAVRGVCFAPDGRRFASAGRDHMIRVWDAVTGAELHCLQGHTADVIQVCFSPDSQLLASASLDRPVRFWNVANTADWRHPWRWITSGVGAKIACLTGHAAEVLGVCFSPDGQRLATASKDNTARVWNATDGKELLRLQGHTADVTCVCFAPNGKQIATGSVDYNVCLWDAATGVRIQRFEGHGHWITNVCFAPDGHTLASSSYDGTARIWDVTKHAEGLQRTDGKEPIYALCFSPDGQRLATAPNDRSVCV